MHRDIDSSPPAWRKRSGPPIDAIAIGLCIAANILDGYDILVMSFAGPSIKSDWGLSSGQLGYLFSVGIVGMGLGGITLGALADRVGRRRVILSCLLCTSSGMILGSCSAGLVQLILCRLLTGIGVGGMMPAINSAVAEFAGSRKRDLTVVVQATGYPIGGAVAGLATTWLLHPYGWRSLVLLGGCLSLLLLLASYWRLPESGEFLLARMRQDGSPSGNLSRLDSVACPVAVGQRSHIARWFGLRGLCESEFARAAVWICTATFLVQFTFYFLVNWAPTLLARQMGETQEGTAAALLLNYGGICGDLLFAGACLRFPPHKSGALTMLSCFLCVALLAHTGPGTGLFAVVVMLIGAFLFASMASLYAIAPAVFPPIWRATGTGLALTVGRLGGAMGPAVGAWFVGAGAPRPPLEMLAPLSLPLLGAAAIMAVAIQRQIRRNVARVRNAPRS